MNDIQIINAKVEHAKEIQQLLCDTWTNTYPDSGLGITKEDIESINFTSEVNIQKRQDKIRDLASTSRFYLAIKGGTIVGMCETFSKNDIGVIKAIYVHPAFQRRGVGKQLFDTALDWLKNVPLIKIELAKHNNKAYKFYKKQGFKSSGTANKYPLPCGKSFPTIEMELKRI